MHKAIYITHEKREISEQLVDKRILIRVFEINWYILQYLIIL